jgi:hypothetical protein
MIVNIVLLASNHHFTHTHITLSFSLSFSVVNCGDPGIVENAVRVGSSFLYDDQVTYTCNDGYFQSSGAVGGVRTCQDTGLWTDTQPECTCKNYNISAFNEVCLLVKI